MQPGETPWPLPVPAPPGESTHLCSSPIYIQGGQILNHPYGGNMYKPQNQPQTKVWRTQTNWHWLSCWTQPGYWIWEILHICGHLRASHSMFGSRYFWLNYSASQSSINCYWITLRGKNKIFLWLQRAPDQNLVTLLFLDGEDLKLKIKTQAGMWLPDLFVFSVVSFFQLE